MWFSTGRAITGAQDEIAFPVPRNCPAGHLCRAFLDADHVGNLATAIRAATAWTAFLVVLA